MASWKGLGVAALAGACAGTYWLQQRRLSGDGETKETPSPDGASKTGPRHFAGNTRLARRNTSSVRAIPGCRPLVICGPSGAGKSTLIHMLMKEFPDDFGFSVSHTTRNPRNGEVDGVDYHFSTNDEMVEMIKNGEFLEHAHVHNRIYGTSVKAVSDVTGSKRICILDIDVQGVQLIMDSDADALLRPKYLFIEPPSIEALEKRLLSRATDSLEQITNRVQTATHEIAVAKLLPFDHRIVNDNLDSAYSDLKQFVSDDRTECAACRSQDS